MNTRDVKRFKDFLILRGAYVDFCDGVRNRHNVTFTQRMRGIGVIPDIINSSLTWDSTDLGHTFWSVLHSEWKTVSLQPEETMGCKSIW